MLTGIVGYGVYIPKGRIKTSEIARVWKKEASDLEHSLGVLEKAVAAIDEDAVTLATQAGKDAIFMSGVNPQEIEAMLVGSESHPYAVNPSSTIVAEALGFSNSYLAADLEFACKAGTAGLIFVAGLVEAGKISLGMAIGSDTAQAKPHDVLEYTAGAGAGAYLLGTKNILANILDYTSFSSDTPDFWRREGMRYPSHGGRFTGEPAYYTHILGAAEALLTKTKTKPSDYDYCVFHSPNGKFPQAIYSRLGFTPEQFKPGFIVDKIGNPYSASSLLSLASVLEIAKPKQKIFLVSYGSGAGSDAFALETTNLLPKARTKTKQISWFINNKNYLDYIQLLKNEKKI
ncbi:MAG: hydroxymethylglutaryl-CoA synthase [Patescibacteria group bacterium]|nr:hydroxymethylglutaryl-CoA synthase [Patescibacteria group bacterium]